MKQHSQKKEKPNNNSEQINIKFKQQNHKITQKKYKFDVNIIYLNSKNT